MFGRLVEANNGVPPLSLRCLWDSPEEAVEALEAAQITVAAVGSGTGCVVISGHASLEEAMALVPLVVQDPAAALVVSYADPSARARIADLCAAPGGKALTLAARGNVVVAADRSIERLRLVRENVNRVRQQGGRSHSRKHGAGGCARTSGQPAGYAVAGCSLYGNGDAETQSGHTLESHAG